MMSTANVSVIIPNWNGRPHLAECLDALRDQTSRPSEVVVVDNGSKDGSLELVRSDYPWVRLIELGQNRGFSAAVNAGIRASRTDYVVLLNNDTRADREFLESLVMAMDEIPEASFGAAKMLTYDEPPRIDSAGHLYSLTRGAALDMGAGEPVARYNRRCWVFGACAGAAIYRRALFDDIGLFDEDFFLIHEDTDIDLRAQAAGHRCMYIPEAIVQHKRGASSNVNEADVWAMAARNRLWAAVKGLPAPLLILWLVLAVPRAATLVAVRELRRRMYPGKPLGIPGWPEGQDALAAAVPRFTSGWRDVWKKRQVAAASRRVGTIRLLAVVLRPRIPID